MLADSRTSCPISARLPWSVRLGWALGQLPIASHVGIVSFYLLYFVTDVHQIAPAWAGVALLVPRLFNIFFDPIMGSVSDRTQSRYGRRRPFLIGGALVWGLAIMMLFGVPGGNGGLRSAAMLFAAFMAVSIGQTLYHVPYSAMLAEMTRDDGERISLASWKEAVSRIGILIAASTVPLVVALFPTEAEGYRVAGLIFGGIIIAGGVVAFFATKHAPATASGGEAISWRRQVRAMFDNKPFQLLVSAYILIMAADEVFSEALIYYAVNVLGQTAAFVGKAYPISSIAAIIFIPAWNAMARRIGNRQALIVAALGMGASWLSILAIPADHAWLMYLMMAAGGAFNAGLLMLPNAMVPETVDFDAASMGQRREGSIYGAWIFCQQSAMAGGGFILSMALTAIGYRAQSGPQPDIVRHGLSIVIAAVPSLLVLTAILLVSAYPFGRRNGQQKIVEEVA